MSRLLVKPAARASGRVIDITPESAGWRYVGFALHRLPAGTAAAGEDAGREALLVLVTGAAKVTVAGADLGELKSRSDIFAWTKPQCVYVPAGAAWEVAATAATELAVCSAPGGPGRAPMVIGPADIEEVTRGKGANTRHIHPLLMEEREGADSLLVTEVLTPQGNWSSYPPHKHDTDDFPQETLLEETYYHRLNPPQGFGLHRIYTDDRSVDETVAFGDGDVTLVPRGYHPTAAPYGYDLYYLNVMAGPRRSWRFRNDPDHDWIFQRDSK